MQVSAKDILCMLAKEFDLKRENTAKRLVLQKTIYLLQAYGLKLGYGFSWYKYGPYSQDLVQDAYEVLNFARPVYQGRTKSFEFSTSCRKRFDKFKEICGKALENPAQLELIASVNFARTTWYPEAEVDDQTFISQFISERKSYLYGGKKVTPPMVQEALKVVKRLRLSQPE
jgi:uncharacterized protein YwgA